MSKVNGIIISNISLEEEKLEKVTLEVTVPEHYEEFHCTGNKCTVTCCTTAWNIALDKNTYDKYKNVRDPKLKKIFSDGIKRVSKTHATSHYYADIKGDEEGFCNFLQEDGLCVIHKNLGEKGLCITCRMFPREQILKRPDGKYETSLTLGCPEVTKLFMLGSDSYKLKTISIEKSINNIVTTLPVTILENHTEGWRNFFFEIRDVCMSFLGYRKISIANRLAVVGMFLNKISTMTEKEQVLPVIEQYTTMLEADKFNNFLESCSTNDAIESIMQESLYFNIINTYRKQKMDSYRLTKLYENFIGLIDMINSEKKFEYDSVKYIIHDYLEEKINKYWNSFLEEHSPSIEKFCSHFMFNDILPGKAEDEYSPFESIFAFATQYAKLKILICTNVEEYGGFTDDLLIDAFTLLTRGYKHGKEKYNLLGNYKNKDLLTLAHYTFLLR